MTVVSALLVVLQMAMSVGRWAATVTRLPDGKLLIAGGYNFAEKNTVRSAEIFDAQTGTFTPVAPMENDRNFAQSALLPDGCVLVCGGFSETRGTRQTAEIYDPKANTWRPTKSDLNDCRELYTATPLADGKVLLSAGLSLKKRGTLASSEVYDPAARTFTPTTGPLAGDRFGHAAVRLADGRVLVVGGQSWHIGQPSTTLASAELYDPKTNTWTPTTGPLHDARDRPTATLLPDGRVLITGGTNKGTPPLMAELYDPQTGTCSPAAALSEGRMAHDAVLLPDGRVLVAGGWADSRKATTPTVEVYDPKTNAWQKLPDLPFHAHDLTLAVFPDGRVLALGGKSTTGDEKAATSVGQAVWVALK